MADFEYTGPTEEDLRVLKQILKAEREHKNLSTEQEAIANRLKAIYGDLSVAQSEMTNERIRGHGALKEDLANLKEQRAEIGRLNNSWAKKKFLREEELAIAQKELEIMRASGTYSKEELATAREDIELKREQVELVEKQKKSVEDLSQSFTKLVTQGVDLREALTVENITKQFGDLANTVMSGATGIADFLDKTFWGLIKGMANNIIQLTLDLVDMGREIQRTTGVSQELANESSAMYKELRQQGVETKEITAAWQTLMGTFTDFEDVSTDARMTMMDTTLVLEKLGVATGDTAEGFQVMTKGMGQTAESAARSLGSLTVLAQDIGVEPGKMAADFKAVSGELTALGENGIKAFKGLARTADTTGLSVSRLLDVALKFDTFEGAAKQAGQLNAALGGNFVNAMDLMMETNPNERFKMLVNSVKDAGLAFDDMSYYQKKMYAESMGLKDVGELAMALSGELETVNEEVEMSAEEWTKLKTQQASVNDLQKQFQTLIAGLIPVIQPAVQLVNNFMKELASPENLKKVEAFSTWLGEGMVTFVKWVIEGVKWVRDFVKGFFQLDSAREIMDKISEIFGKVKKYVMDLLPSFDQIKKTASGWMERIAEALKSVDWDKVVPMAIKLFKTWAATKLGTSVVKIELMAKALNFAASATEKLSGAWEFMKKGFGMTKVGMAVNMIKGLRKEVTEGNSPALWELLKGFGPDVTKIGKAFSVLTSPLKAVASIFDDMGAMINNIMEVITAIPAMIMEINKLDVTKAEAMGAMMVAGGTATAVAAAGAGATAPAAAPAAGAPATFVIPVQIDGNEIGKVAYEYYGNKIKQINGLG